MATLPRDSLASCPMLLTDLFNWPVRSHNQACLNALRGSLESARNRREREDAERFVEQVNRQRRPASIG